MVLEVVLALSSLSVRLTVGRYSVTGERPYKQCRRPLALPVGGMLPALDWWTTALGPPSTGRRPLALPVGGALPARLVDDRA